MKDNGKQDSQPLKKRIRLNVVWLLTFAISGILGGFICEHIFEPYLPPGRIYLHILTAISGGATGAVYARLRVGKGAMLAGAICGAAAGAIRLYAIFGVD